MLNKVFRTIGVVLSISVLFVLLVAAISTSQETVFRKVVVDIDFAGENYFLDNNDVESAVFDLGYMADSTFLKDVDPRRIELTIGNQAFVENAEVYKELNGDVHVEVLVRKPIMRVYNDLGQSVYIDQHGVIMPTSRRFAARTPIVNGNISLMLHSYIGKNVAELPDLIDHKSVKVITDAYSVLSYCSKDPFWRAQFNQVYIDSKGELELIPRVGDHQILVGNGDNIEKKLNKLWHFYQEGLSKTGWNEYKTINLKYANQVVCTKR